MMTIFKINVALKALEKAWEEQSLENSTIFVEKNPQKNKP